MNEIERLKADLELIRKDMLARCAGMPDMIEAGEAQVDWLARLLAIVERNQ